MPSRDLCFGNRDKLRIGSGEGWGGGGGGVGFSLPIVLKVFVIDVFLDIEQT